MNRTTLTLGTGFVNRYKEEFTNPQLNLELLTEEASEVIRIKSKCFRFGLHSYHPKNEYPNKAALGVEVGHFLFILDLLISQGVIDINDISGGYKSKPITLRDWYSSATYFKQLGEDISSQTIPNNQ